MMNIPNTNGPLSKVHVQLASQQAEAGNSETNQGSVAKSTENSRLQPDTVTLSEEAKAKAGEGEGDEQDGGRLSGLTLNDQQATEKKSDVEAIDEKIEELQEKVRELMKQIAKLRTKDDQASVEQVKALEAQLAQLNSQLMELTSQKLKMIEG